MIATRLTGAPPGKIRAREGDLPDLTLIKPCGPRHLDSAGGMSGPTRRIS